MPRPKKVPDLIPSEDVAQPIQTTEEPTYVWAEPDTEQESVTTTETNEPTFDVGTRCFARFNAEASIEVQVKSLPHDGGIVEVLAAREQGNRRTTAVHISRLHTDRPRRYLHVNTLAPPSVKRLALPWEE